jgi:hypothetical protein
MSSGCVRLLDRELAPDAWLEAAARACHPGASRFGETVTKTTAADGSWLIDIPDAIRTTCFSVYAIAPQDALPITVQLVDDKDQVQNLETLQSTRNAIPALGPLCSLDGRVRKLKFVADAFYAAH